MLIFTFPFWTFTCTWSFYFQFFFLSFLCVILYIYPFNIFLCTVIVKINQIEMTGDIIFKMIIKKVNQFIISVFGMGVWWIELWSFSSFTKIKLTTEVVFHIYVYNYLLLWCFWLKVWNSLNHIYVLDEYVFLDV